METSIKLDTKNNIEIFGNTKPDVNYCYKILLNQKKSDIPEKRIGPRKQTVTGCHAIASDSNNFFSVFNVSDNFFNDFTDNELNETEFSIEIAKDPLNVSNDEFGPDPKPGQVLRNCSKSLSINFYNLVSSIKDFGAHPSPKKQTIVHPIPRDARKVDITNYRPITSLSKISLAFEKSYKLLSPSICSTSYLLINLVFESLYHVLIS